MNINVTTLLLTFCTLFLFLLVGAAYWGWH
jgi:hypothetical protein